MKTTLFAAAFVATAYGEEIDTKQAEEMALGFLHGIGLSEDFDNCFAKVSGFEEAVKKVTSDAECGGMNIASRKCINDMYAIVTDISQGLEGCPMTDEDTALMNRMNKALSSPLSIALRLGREIMQFGDLGKYTTELSSMWSAYAEPVNWEEFGEHLGKLISLITGIHAETNEQFLV